MNLKLYSKSNDYLLQLMVILLIVLPSRVFFYGLMDQIVYPMRSMNLYDLLVLSCLFYVIIRYRKFSILRRTCILLWMILVGSVVGFFSRIDSFAVEIIEKLLIVFLAFLILSALSAVKNGHNEIYKSFVIGFMIVSGTSPLFASFGAFGQMNRVGSLGFGPNEMAMISVILFNQGLNCAKERRIQRVIMVFLGTIGVLTSSSRRGLLLVLILVVLFFIRLMVISFGKLKKVKYSVVISLIMILIIMLILLMFSGREVLSFVEEKFSESPAYIRFQYYLNSGQQLIDFQSRNRIFETALDSIADSPVIGVGFSDSYIATTFFGGNLHSHNLFLQLFLQVGIVLGSIIVIFVLLVLLANLTKIDKFIHKPSFFFFAQALLVYIAFELFGYSLWWPKLLFIFAVCLFAVLDAQTVFLQKGGSQK